MKGGGESESGLNRCHGEAGRTTDLSKRTLREERKRERTMGWRRWREAGPGGRRSGEVALSPDLHFDKKSRGKFSPISRRFLSYSVPSPSSSIWSPKDKETPSRPSAASLSLSCAFPLPPSHIPVLFLPHYAGLAYPGRPALWTQLPRWKLVFPWKMSIKATRRGGGKREGKRTGKLEGIGVSRIGLQFEFFYGGNRAHDLVFLKYAIGSERRSGPG